MDDYGISLSVDSLQKNYKTPDNKSLTVLKDVNLKLKHGITAILGPNGAGKTTLIKSCTDLLDYDKGNIYYYGHDLKRMTKAEKSLTYTVLSEGNRNIYWKLTPIENIRYFAALRGINYKQINNLSLYLLNELNIYDKKNVLVENLSRGMQQKTAIVCALAMNTKVVFLDEPTLGLDVESSINMSYFLIHNEALREKLILISSHDFSFIGSTAQKILKLQEGIIVEKDEKEEINNTYIIKVKHPNEELLRHLGSEITDSNTQYCSIRVNVPYYDLGQAIQRLNNEGFNVISAETENMNIRSFYLNKTE